MARISKWPFFLGGGGKPVTRESLLDDADCTIDKYNGVVWMDTDTAWSDRHKALARKHKVTHIHLCTTSFGDHQTAEFLLDVPEIRGLTIRLYAVKDLSIVGHLSQLEHLRIHLEVWRLGDRFKPVDFSALSKMQHADVTMCRAFESRGTAHPRGSHVSAVAISPRASSTQNRLHLRGAARRKVL